MNKAKRNSIESHSARSGLPDREDIHTEFKAACSGLPENLCDTLCAFLNTDGGMLYLGVSDNGEVLGLAPEQIERYKKEIASLSNNPQKIDPPYLLFPREETIAGKSILVVQVPLSSQLHRHKGEVYLRSDEGDNPAMAYFHTRITPQNLRSHPKNPSICKFMIQIARFDQLGSGVLNIHKYWPLYAPGTEPIFRETPHGFELILPLPESAAAGQESKPPEVTPPVTGVESRLESGAESGAESGVESSRRIMTALLHKTTLSKSEIMRRLGLKGVTGALNRSINNLLSNGLIERTLPDKPNSRLQKYRLTEKGRMAAGGVKA